MSSDYLLAGEGGVCGKFKRSDYCLQIDDKGQAVSYIATNIRKIAHVPIQSCKGWDSNNFFGGWFSVFRGFITLAGIVLLLLGSCLLLPSLLHLVVWSAASLTEATVERKAAAKILVCEITSPGPGRLRGCCPISI